MKRLRFGVALLLLSLYLMTATACGGMGGLFSTGGPSGAGGNTPGEQRSSGEDNPPEFRSGEKPGPNDPGIPTLHNNDLSPLMDDGSARQSDDSGNSTVMMANRSGGGYVGTGNDGHGTRRIKLIVAVKNPETGKVAELFVGAYETDRPPCFNNAPEVMVFPEAPRPKIKIERAASLNDPFSLVKFDYPECAATGWCQTDACGQEAYEHPMLEGGECRYPIRITVWYDLPGKRYRAQRSFGCETEVGRVVIDDLIDIGPPEAQMHMPPR